MSEWPQGGLCDTCLRAHTLLPAHLSEESQVAQAVPSRVSPWGCSTQRTCQGPCGRTSCLGAHSAGSHCPFSPRLQHSSWSVALQRDHVNGRPATWASGKLLITAGLLTREGEPTHHTSVGLDLKQGGIRVSFPDLQGRKGPQRGHLRYPTRLTQGRRPHVPQMIFPTLALQVTCLHLPTQAYQETKPHSCLPLSISWDPGSSQVTPRVCAPVWSLL